MDAKLVAPKATAAAIAEYLSATGQGHDKHLTAARILVRLESNEKKFVDNIPGRIAALKEEGELARVLEESGVAEEQRKRAEAIAEAVAAGEALPEPSAPEPIIPSIPDLPPSGVPAGFTQLPNPSGGQEDDDEP